MSARVAIPTWFFALVVVRRDDRFLLAQERKYGQTWTIPGGRVELGEALADAAVREVLEETGIRVRLDGVLRVEHSPVPTGTRVRVIFIGTAVDDAPPKSVADDESLRAAWLTLDEIRALPLRGRELADLLAKVAAGAPVLPMALLGHELSV
jgi:phosphatase NudJ|nr:NUDIX domain-containing protein [Kofleriaceae bacterium]